MNEDHIAHCQTFFAFAANNTYKHINTWFAWWRTHHYDRYDNTYWCPRSILEDNSNYLNWTRPFPGNPRTALTHANWLNSTPIIQCLHCGLWLSSAKMYSLHTPNSELPSFISEGEDYPEDSVCWKLYTLQWRLLTYENSRHVPRFLVTSLATREQIDAKQAEPYDPVVCAHCKVWLQDPGCAAMHKQCALVCWKTRHAFWKQPSVADFSDRNYHVLGLACNVPRWRFFLKPIVLWRHAFMQIFQHKYAILCYQGAIMDLAGPTSDSEAIFQVLCLQHVCLNILSYTIAPFWTHTLLSKRSIRQKKLAIQTICNTVRYLRHY